MKRFMNWLTNSFTPTMNKFSQKPVVAALSSSMPVSYTHLRAHETGRNLVCRLLLEKKKL